MEVLRARGNVAEALRVYEDMRVLLREELGSSPGAALVALHEQLLRDERAGARPPPRRAAPTPPSSARRARPRGRAARHAARRGDRGRGPRGADRGPAGDRQDAPAGRVPPPRRAPRARSCSTRARASSSASSRSASCASCSRRVDRPTPTTLTGAAAPAARRVRRARATAPPGGDASFAALHGLYWLALNLAAERPLVLEVDDLHWCDRPSLRFLAYLVRRLEGQPILVAATVRTGDPPTDAALLAEIANDPATAHVRPGPLSEEAVGELVAQRLGAEPDHAFREACHRTTGGNPLLVRQLLTALEADGVTPDAAHADVVRAIGSRAVSSRVLLRLARLPGEAAAVARAVAVLGEGAELPAVAGVAGLDEAQVADTMAALARAEILRPEPPPGFVHPLVRDAVYHGLPLGRARAAARARRRACCARPAPPLDQVAGQLMLTPRRGDAEVARAAARGRHRRRWRAAPPTAPSATCGARSTSRRRAERARGCCSTSARVEALTRGPEAAAAPARGLRRARPTRTCASRAANALGRALLFTSSPAEGAAVAREAAARAAAGAGGRARSALEAFALMGVPFGALDPAETRAHDPVPRDRRRGRPARRAMAAMAALDWAHERRPRRRRASRSALAALDGRRADRRTTRTC